MDKDVRPMTMKQILRNFIKIQKKLYYNAFDHNMSDCYIWF